jgi:uncharacterized protein YggU (UPF0235/DUF167 family)
MSELVTKVNVTFVTRAKSAGVDIINPHTLKVRTSGTPKGESANNFVQRMLARHYGLPLTHVVLKSGEKINKKVFLIIEK